MRQVQEEMQNTLIENRQRNYKSNGDSIGTQALAVIKIKWEKREEKSLDLTVQGIQPWLRSYGEIMHVLPSAKKRSALVEFRSVLPKVCSSYLLAHVIF